MSIITRRIQAEDAALLAEFYNGLSWESKRTFRPLGEKTTSEKCRDIVQDNISETGRRYDLMALDGERIVGWGFLWSMDSGAPSLGLGVADAYHGQGLGGRLMDEVMAYARGRELRRVVLTVVQDNHKARKMYERRGFVKQEAFVGEDGLPYYAMAADLPAKLDSEEEDGGGSRRLREGR